MEDSVDRSVDEDVLGNVKLDESKVRRAQEVGDVSCVAGDQVIDRRNAVPLGEQPIAEVRSKESRPASNDGVW